MPTNSSNSRALAKLSRTLFVMGTSWERDLIGRIPVGPGRGRWRSSISGQMENILRQFDPVDACHPSDDFLVARNGLQHFVNMVAVCHVDLNGLELDVSLYASHGIVD